MNGEHGTYGGYQRHNRRRELPCEACLVAARDYQRRFRALNPATRERDRWWTRTRSRAFERLACEYPERFAEILAEVRQADPDPALAARP